MNLNIWNKGLRVAYKVAPNDLTIMHLNTCFDTQHSSAWITYSWSATDALESHKNYIRNQPYVKRYPLDFLIAYVQSIFATTSNWLGHVWVNTWLEPLNTNDTI
jgi:hypothetical protein